MQTDIHTDKNEYFFQSDLGVDAPLSVTDALEIAKKMLRSFSVKLVGEVSEFTCKSGYKAVYFSVKDNKSTLPCLMWFNKYSACNIDINVGDLVEITGKFSIYTQKGRMNFEVDSISIAGEGDLRQKVANIAKKLEKEGLTSQEKKRLLPKYPESIGLVTSPRGAAVHDVLRTLRRRFPVANIVLAGVPVEGRDAPKNIIDGINRLCEESIEVLLVVRGGGSFEDLMPFNDEELARCIALCPVPVVTGIGHEPDTTIADMVSDFRASTPTGAAEAVSPSFDELRNVFESSSKKMYSVLIKRLDSSNMMISSVKSRPAFSDPSYMMSNYMQSVDAYNTRLHYSLSNSLNSDKSAVESMKQSIKSNLKDLNLKNQMKINELRTRSCKTVTHFKSKFQSQYDLYYARLCDLSPLSILKRGYTITKNGDGSIVKTVESVSKGDEIYVSMLDGEIKCDVKDIKFVNTDYMEI